MNLITKSSSPLVRANLVFVAYTIILFFLLLGAQRFIHQQWGINVFEQIASSLLPIANYLYELAGWTLIGFVPMALFLAWITCRKLIGAFNQWDAGYCQWINELAVALGLLGTIRGFIVVASEQSTSLSSGPTETLSAILVGMGSTFIGIALAIWALLLQSPASKS